MRSKAGGSHKATESRHLAVPNLDTLFVRDPNLGCHPKVEVEVIKDITKRSHDVM